MFEFGYPKFEITLNKLKTPLINFFSKVYHIYILGTS